MCRRAKRLKKVARMLTSGVAQAAAKAWRQHTLILLVVVCAAHICCCVVLTTQVDSRHSCVKCHHQRVLLVPLLQSYCAVHWCALQQAPYTHARARLLPGPSHHIATTTGCVHPTVNTGTQWL